MGKERKIFHQVFKGPSIIKNASKKHALWQYHLHFNSVKGYTKMTGRPPFLPIYSHEADI